MFKKLFRSRKFCLMLFDLVLSMGLYFLARWINPNAYQDVFYVIGLMQLPVAAVIRAITIEDKWNTEDFDPLPPLTMLFSSKQFWVMALDVVVSVSAYFVGKYVNPQQSQDIRWMITTMQPVALFVIEAWTQEGLPITEFIDPLEWELAGIEIDEDPAAIDRSDMESDGTS